MTSSALESWLRRRFRVEAGMGFLVGLLALALGLVVMFVTFWLAYAVVWVAGEATSAIVQIAGGKPFRIPHDWRLIGAGVFLVLLFVNHLRTSPWDRGDYSYFGDPESSIRMRVANTLFPRRSGVANSLQRLLVHPQASARMIAEILETGPRCLTEASAILRRATALCRSDVGACASALTVLCAHVGAVDGETLAGYVPAGHDWRTVKRQLANIEGVVFLSRGLTLTDELRSELNQHIHAPL
jgi:hypothetical protein